jgi:hypothetical protein
MGVWKVTRKPKESAGDASPLNGPGSADARLTFQVLVDAPATDTVASVLADPRVPQPKAAHPDGFYLRVAGRGCNRINQVTFEVEIDYASPPGGQAGENPLNTPPSIEFDAVPVETEIDVDINGRPIVMKTGERFDPKPRELVYEPTITVTRNVTWIDPYVIASYRNSVNSDTWYGMPPGTVWITALRAVNQITPEWVYWQASGTFQLRGAAPGSTERKAWWLRLLAQGYTVNVPAALSFTDADLNGAPAMKDGAPVTSPVLHDPATGYQLSDTANARWYEFETKRAMPFANLGLI